MLTFVAIAGIPIGIYLFIAGIRARKNVDRYEFENRTSGGVVEFKDYDASRNHDWLVRKANNLPGLGAVIAGMSVFLLFISF